jgi:hypothetical protein
VVAYTQVHSFIPSPNCQEGSLDVGLEVASAEVKKMAVLADITVQLGGGDVRLVEGVETELLHDL